MFVSVCSSDVEHMQMVLEQVRWLNIALNTLRYFNISETSHSQDLHLREIIMRIFCSVLYTVGCLPTDVLSLKLYTVSLGDTEICTNCT